MPGIVTLVGAGELMSSMSRVHREAFAAVSGPVRPVFLDITAGFETNADAIVEKAVEFYSHHLQTELHVASYRHRERATQDQIAAAITEIRAANLIFAGPGSPTYALHHWRDSAVWDAVVERFEAGAALFFASAAAITVGRYSLPVYEIYKAGQDPFWAEGMDILGRLGLPMAVVPHFDDNSGGDNYDTRYCYMGGDRFNLLQESLPDDVTILGIDAYTAISFNGAGETARVFGQGGVTVIGDGAQRTYPAGSTLSFNELRSSSRQRMQTASPQSYGYEFSDDDAAGDDADALGVLKGYIERLPNVTGNDKLELLVRLEEVRRHFESQRPGDEAPLVDLLLELRGELRGLKRFDLADRTRDVLNEIGIEIGDSPQGTTWSRREPT